MSGTDHENNNSMSSANRYPSPPTYEALERSICGYEMDMQSKFKTVLKTALFTETLPGGHVRLLVFPKPCYILEGWDICLEGVWGFVSFPPASAYKNLSFWAITSHHKCPHKGFSLLPITPAPEDLALHVMKLIPPLYFSVHSDLFVLM